jgi:hypothetical protein
MSREIPEFCSIISPRFLEVLYAGIKGLPQDSNRLKLDDSAFELASVCGYQLFEDKWVKFPKRAEALERVCRTYGPGDKIGRGQCDIVEEHGDGDLTVQTEDNVFVITTDGRVFREIQPQDR